MIRRKADVLFWGVIVVINLEMGKHTWDLSLTYGAIEHYYWVNDLSLGDRKPH